MFNLGTTPYLLDDEASREVRNRLKEIEDRVSLLRQAGTLTEQTIRDYYGEKRFEQVAESNAIEGSTLSVGETELAVLKGITITGHDPAFTRDAVALDRALNRIVELARETSVPTNIEQVHEVHALLLGDRPGAGMFRNERVTIRGARHTPPRTWGEIMDQMTDWEGWSVSRQALPAPLRSAVLHAWLTHIHPYIDGNGRTARAIGNLELIRAGYPPIIIKSKDRDHYREALAESDEGGDIRSFLELILDRVDGALTGLEQSAGRRHGDSPAMERIRQQQEQQLSIWETSVKLLASIIELRVSQRLEPVGGACSAQIYNHPLDLEDYIEVCSGRSIPRAWAFKVRLEVPGRSRVEKLASIGHRSARMYEHLGREGGPSLFWNREDPAGFPRWIRDEANSPFAVEVTTRIGNGDEWFARLKSEGVEQLQTTELAHRIADALFDQVSSK